MFLRNAGTYLPKYMEIPDIPPGFPQSLQARAGIIFRFGHDQFLPNPFQSVIHQSSYNLTSYNLNAENFGKTPQEMHGAICQKTVI
jgi:hypothetical protein